MKAPVDIVNMDISKIEKSLEQLEEEILHDIDDKI